ncbi:MAG: hypothetical protein ABS46_01730 [Cytophagaceae bacterium SCN 52-12]|nr:MAG: hypothetical protein ABS46_01730 [Cytophagaceae bacterium SCN 52-12]
MASHHAASPGLPAFFFINAVAIPTDRRTSFEASPLQGAVAFRLLQLRRSANFPEKAYQLRVAAPYTAASLFGRRRPGKPESVYMVC